jgi:hypothetical protein
MAASGLDNLRRLREHHLPAMAPGHQRVLLLRLSGLSFEQIAKIEDLSESTIKARLSTASSEIAMCLEEGKLLAEQRGGWIIAHRPCCLAREAARLGRQAA